MDALPVALKKPVPFDTALLDRLLDEAGIDVLLATSKHNVQYLLGGYRSFFFDTMDAMGVSRYLPIVAYQKGRPDNAAYFGSRQEKWDRDLDRFWPPVVEARCSGSTDAMRLALEHVRRLGPAVKAIGVEPAFLPMDAYEVLRDGCGGARIVDALVALERLRARKTPEELALLREASESVIAAMLVAFAQCTPGRSKYDIVDTLRREEVARGLTFDYCLMTAGSSLNRAPSDQRLASGDVISLDSGGNRKGYIGDLCRMGIIGDPDQELLDLLGHIEEIQQAARQPIRAGARGGDIFDAPQSLLARSPHRGYVDFMAHGMGLISHEAPRLKTYANYTGDDAGRALEAGMVVSIETTMLHPQRGFIKLEDTVAVTETGWEGFGDTARGWNPAGTQP